MLTRLYVDNFRCFIDFECRFDGNKQLIMGRNGSGKTSLFDALRYLRQFAVTGGSINPSLSQRTKLLEKRQQSFEIEASLYDDPYVYRLVIEPGSIETEPLVKSETIFCCQKPLFEFVDGQVHLYNDRFELKNAYPLDFHHSALATISETSGNTRLNRFKDWFSRLACFKLNPFVSLKPLVRSEQKLPRVDLSNFVDWYWHLTRLYPSEQSNLFEDLSAAIDGFQSLRFKSPVEGFHALIAEFVAPDQRNVKLFFNELSDGQRCLICLYTILHFVVAKGGTVILDEPENFLALREIQPWLMTLADVLDEGHGQAILLSHHPEVINQWAPNYGIQLVRDGAGPVYAEKFAGRPEYALPAAELVARGWELE